jgi:hypothetical protein
MSAFLIFAVCVNGIDSIATRHWTVELRLVLSQVCERNSGNDDVARVGSEMVEAIVVKDQVAGTVAMKLPEPQERWPALNGAGVEVYASGFASGDLMWLSVDRCGTRMAAPILSALTTERHPWLSR